VWQFIIVMLDVILLNVDVLNVVAPYSQALWKIFREIDEETEN
jgi:hypothetical protein